MRIVSVERVIGPAFEAGLANLLRHIENLGKFGLPVVVAINRFASDTAAELALIDRLCAERNVRAVLSDHFARGGAGGEDLARVVVETLDRGGADFRPLYPDDLALVRKIETEKVLSPEIDELLRKTIQTFKDTVPY